MALSLFILPSLHSCSSSVNFSRRRFGSRRPNSLITSGVRKACAIAARVAYKFTQYMYI